MVGYIKFMSKPYIHALSSAKKFGGKPEDYEPIHSFLDSSKGTVADNRHRCLTHQAWFLSNILERICFPNSCPMTGDYRFPTITNSAGRVVSVRDIGEQHVLEDFRGKFIPTPQDYFDSMTFESWMQNGNGSPPSAKMIDKTRVTKVESWENLGKE